MERGMMRILPESICAAAAGKPYRPSNGTEGEYFEAQFCDRCKKMRKSPEASTQCGIYLRVSAYDIKDKKYPKQWRYAPDGSGPECTSFKPRMASGVEKRAALRRHLTP
jgi:hypothetical protein